ncbi:MAG: prolyl oligopeptidase family serine peptidase [Chloroflexi bacterium]|nr:prolyl oligopeptidase family serine peptidase [Chloroflexota bacterium]
MPQKAARKAVAPYGSWKSPVTPDLITAGSVRLGEIRVGGEGLYWLEGRPSEAGRYVIVRMSPDGAISDAIPEGFNVRTAVHEYGGGAYAVHGGTIYFSNWDDQRLYRQAPGAKPEPITPAPAIARGDRYADLEVTPDGRHIVCVRERHHDGREADNELVVIPADGSAGPRVIASGRDFYSSPRVSPDGASIAWTAWDHPNMPWDGTELWSATLNPDATVAFEAQIAGGKDESIIQPEWSPGGLLHFISDSPGWWNLFSWRDGAAVNLLPEKFDAGGASWAFGFSTCCLLEDGSALVRKSEGATGALVTVAPGGGRTGAIDIPYSDISSVQSAGDAVYFIGASPTREPAVVRLDLASGATTVVKQSSSVTVNPDYISAPEPISFPTTGSAIAHAYFYAPKNRDFQGQPGELPPLMVICHGGPTSATSASLSLMTQFWTSRGIAVVDVNYRGSTGYGRAYRNALRENWGRYDTDDCIAAADYLATRGLTDRRRTVIRGGSAGGYTTINALTFHKVFAAGAAYYGIADLSVFLGDTHKFESRYLDSLIGPYPQEKQRYHDRSAINFTDQLSAPMIIFQGLEDKIVPPSQAEIMVKALEEKRIMHAYVPFAGEQHGFRKSENIERALEAELYFYGVALGFAPADSIEPVDIRNMKRASR